MGLTKGILWRPFHHTQWSNNCYSLHIFRAHLPVYYLPFSTQSRRRTKESISLPSSPRPCPQPTPIQSKQTRLPPPPPLFTHARKHSIIIFYLAFVSSLSSFLRFSVNCFNPPDNLLVSPSHPFS